MSAKKNKAASPSSGLSTPSKKPKLNKTAGKTVQEAVDLDTDEDAMSIDSSDPVIVSATPLSLGVAARTPIDWFLVARNYVEGNAKAFLKTRIAQLETENTAMNGAGPTKSPQWLADDQVLCAIASVTESLNYGRTRNAGRPDPLFSLLPQDVFSASLVGDSSAKICYPRHALFLPILDTSLQVLSNGKDGEAATDDIIEINDDSPDGEALGRHYRLAFVQPSRVDNGADVTWYDSAGDPVPDEAGPAVKLLLERMGWFGVSESGPVRVTPGLSPRQNDNNSCGPIVVLLSWIHALGLKPAQRVVQLTPLGSRQLYKLINCAIGGHLDVWTIYAFICAYGFHHAAGTKLRPTTAKFGNLRTWKLLTAGDLGELAMDGGASVRAIPGGTAATLNNQVWSGFPPEYVVPSQRLACYKWTDQAYAPMFGPGSYGLDEAAIDAIFKKYSIPLLSNSPLNVRRKRCMLEIVRLAGVTTTGDEVPLHIQYIAAKRLFDQPGDLGSFFSH